MATERALPLRAALVIALAAGVSHAACDGLGLQGDPATFGAVIAALVVRPDFSRWPMAIYPVLLAVVGLCMAIGVSLALALSAFPRVFLFGLVAALMQLLTLLLPARLRILSGVIAVAGILPLLGTPSWDTWGQELQAIALGLAVGTAVQITFSPAQRKTAAPAAGSAEPEEPEAPLAERIRQGLCSPFFWRKLIFASLGLAIGEGLGAATPKYLYFGVVLLLNDTIGATLARVRDRMVGVSLGVLMPLLVFNSFGMGDLEVALVMGGTAALVTALNFDEHLRTALISSGVAFIGYGPLVAWYIPNRWVDYLMGCALAVSVGVLLFPNSALRRFNRLSAEGTNRRAELTALLPEAREEARWLGLPEPHLPEPTALR